MKLLLTTILVIASSISFSQIFIGAQPVSRFERDGKIWISSDPKNAPVQTFVPIEERYECRGTFMKLIVDTTYINGFYEILFGDKKAVEVKAVPMTGGEPFSHHIMFVFMAACFDTDFIYCQCGQRFKIVKRNF